MADPVLKISAELIGLEKSAQRALANIEKQARIKIQLEDKASLPLGRISKNASEIEKSLDAATSRVIAFGAAATVLVTISRGFESLAKSIVDVEDSLAKININFQATQQQLSVFSKEIFQAARNSATSFNEAAKAAEELARQGLGVEETTRRLNDSLILSRRAGISSAEAVETLTAAINSYASAGLDTTQIVNKLVAVDTRFAVSTSDLSEAISRAASTAQEAGVQFDEFLGIVTAVQQTTSRGGAVIGNALKTIFTRVQAAPETIKALEKLGVAIQDSSGQFTSAGQRLREYAQIRQSLSDGDRAYYDRIISGTQQINILTAALNDLAKANSISSSAQRISSAATNEAIVQNEKLNKTLKSVLSQTGTTFTEVFANVGKELGSSIAKALSGFNDILGSVFQLDGFVKGVSNVLTGPALISALVLFGKTFAFVGKDIAKAISAFAGLNTKALEQAKIEEKIREIKAAATNEELRQLGLANSIIAKRDALLAIEKRITAEKRSQDLINSQISNSLLVSGAGRSGFLGSGGSNLATKVFKKGVLGGIVSEAGYQANPKLINKGNYSGTQFFASGYSPVQQEMSAIKRGVGGASPSAKPVVIPNFNFGKGKMGSVVANTDEYLVPNYAFGGTAVFNKDMIKQMGLPSGARKVGMAGGFIPNFDKKLKLPKTLNNKEISKRLESAFQKGKDYSIFYDEISSAFKNKSDAVTFAGIASALSPRVPDYIAGQASIKTFENFKKTKSISVDDYLDLETHLSSKGKQMTLKSLGFFGEKGARRKGLEKALSGLTLARKDTDKTRQYAQALSGDKNAFPIDTNVLRAIFGKTVQGTLTQKDSKRIINIAKQTASSIGIDPRQLQAGIFKGVNDRFASKYNLEYIKSLKDKLASIAASGYIPNFANKSFINKGIAKELGGGAEGIGYLLGDSNLVTKKYNDIAALRSEYVVSKFLANQKSGTIEFLPPIGSLKRSLQRGYFAKQKTDNVNYFRDLFEGGKENKDIIRTLHGIVDQSATNIIDPVLKTNYLGGRADIHSGNYGINERTKKIFDNIIGVGKNRSAKRNEQIYNKLMDNTIFRRGFADNFISKIGKAGGKISIFDPVFFERNYLGESNARFLNKYKLGGIANGYIPNYANILNKKYELGDLLGEGSYKKVFNVKSRQMDLFEGLSGGASNLNPSDLVMSIMNRKNSDFDKLAALRSAGGPAAQIFETGKYRIGKSLKEAALMEKLDTISINDIMKLLPFANSYKTNVNIANTAVSALSPYLKGYRNSGFTGEVKGDLRVDNFGISKGGDRDNIINILAELGEAPGKPGPYEIRRMKQAFDSGLKVLDAGFLRPIGFSGGYVPNYANMRLPRAQLAALLKSKKFQSIDYTKKNGESATYNAAQWRVNRDQLVGADAPQGYKSWTDFDDKTNSLVLNSLKEGESEAKMRRFLLNNISRVRANGQTYDIFANGYVPNYANPYLKRKGLATEVGKGAFAKAFKLKGKDIVTKELRPYDAAVEYLYGKLLSKEGNVPGIKFVEPIGSLERTFKRGYVGKPFIKNAASFTREKLPKASTDIIYYIQQMIRGRADKETSKRIWEYMGDADSHAGNYGINDIGFKFLNNIIGTNKKPRSPDREDDIARTLFDVFNSKKKTDRFFNSMAKKGGAIEVYDPIAIYGSAEKLKKLISYLSLRTGISSDKLNLANGYVPNYAKKLDKGMSATGLLYGGNIVSKQFSKGLNEKAIYEYTILKLAEQSGLPVSKVYGSPLEAYKKNRILKERISDASDIYDIYNENKKDNLIRRLASSSRKSEYVKNFSETEEDVDKWLKINQDENNLKINFRKKGFSPLDINYGNSLYKNNKLTAFDLGEVRISTQDKLDEFSKIINNYSFLNKDQKEYLIKRASYGIGKDYASGYIPNFADPLKSAISREIAAGVNPRDIYIDKDSRVKGPGNPAGLLVANKRDEPLGGKQGVNRALKEGMNPRKYGSFANGIIPNFAEFDKLTGYQLNPFTGERKTFTDIFGNIKELTKIIDPADAKALRRLFIDLRQRGSDTLESFIQLQAPLSELATSLFSADKITKESYDIIQKKINDIAYRASEKESIKAANLAAFIAKDEERAKKDIELSKIAKAERAAKMEEENTSTSYRSKDFYNYIFGGPGSSLAGRNQFTQDSFGPFPKPTFLEKGINRNLFNLSFKQLEDVAVFSNTNVGRPGNVLGMDRTDVARNLRNQINSYRGKNIDRGFIDVVSGLSKTETLDMEFVKNVKTSLSKGMAFGDSLEFASKEFKLSGGSTKKLRDAIVNNVMSLRSFEQALTDSKLQFKKQSKISAANIRLTTLANRAQRGLEATGDLNQLAKRERGIVVAGLRREAISELGYSSYSRSDLARDPEAQRAIKEAVDKKINNLQATLSEKVTQDKRAKSLEGQSSRLGSFEKRLGGLGAGFGIFGSSKADVREYARLRRSGVLNAEDAMLARGIIRERADRRESRRNMGSLAASFALPMLAGFVPEGKGGTVSGIAGGIISGAGIGAGYGGVFGPYGIAIGAAAGAIVGAFSKLQKSTEELVSEFDKQATAIVSITNDVGSVGNLQSRLNEAIQSGNKNEIFDARKALMSQVKDITLKNPDVGGKLSEALMSGSADELNKFISDFSEKQNNVLRQIQAGTDFKIATKGKFFGGIESEKDAITALSSLSLRESFQNGRQTYTSAIDKNLQQEILDLRNQIAAPKRGNYSSLASQIGAGGDLQTNIFQTNTVDLFLKAKGIFEKVKNIPEFSTALQDFDNITTSNYESILDVIQKAANASEITATKLNNIQEKQREEIQRINSFSVLLKAQDIGKQVGNVQLEGAFERRNIFRSAQVEATSMLSTESKARNFKTQYDIEAVKGSASIELKKLLDSSLSSAKDSLKGLGLSDIQSSAILAADSFKKLKIAAKDVPGALQIIDDRFKLLSEGQTVLTESTKNSIDAIKANAKAQDMLYNINKRSNLFIGGNLGKNEPIRNYRQMLKANVPDTQGLYDETKYKALSFINSELGIESPELKKELVVTRTKTQLNRGIYAAADLLDLNLGENFNPALKGNQDYILQRLKSQSQDQSVSKESRDIADAFYKAIKELQDRIKNPDKEIKDLESAAADAAKIIQDNINTFQTTQKAILDSTNKSIENVTAIVDKLVSAGITRNLEVDVTGFIEVEAASLSEEARIAMKQEISILIKDFIDKRIAQYDNGQKPPPKIIK